MNIQSIVIIRRLNFVAAKLPIENYVGCEFSRNHTGGIDNLRLMILLRDGRDDYDDIFGDGYGHKNIVTSSRGDPQVANHPVGRMYF